MVRGILLFLLAAFISLPCYSLDPPANNPSAEEFRQDLEFGSRRPHIAEDWDGGDGHLRVTLIETTKAASKGSIQKLLQEFGPRERLLYLNLDHKPESPSELEEMILEDERIQKLPSEMATDLKAELTRYKNERTGMIKRFSQHIAAVHFASTLGAFTVISYLGEDIPHLAHWLVGFALAWECWLGQRYILQINRFLYNVADNFFKGSETLFQKLGIKNNISQLAINLENTLSDELPAHKAFPKKLMVSFITFLLYTAEWGIYQFQYHWITEFFIGKDLNNDAFFHALGEAANWSFWGFALKASLLDLFSEGIPHWAINNFSKTSKLDFAKQAKFIYAWSSAVSLLIAFTTMGALATNIAFFKWVSFPVAAAGFGYFLFDGVLRHTLRERRRRIQKTSPSTSRLKKYSCFLRLSSNGP
ncbi:MAG: hypothetical protein R3A80_00065 [Bdellovibrionota bacterium]